MYRVLPRILFVLTLTASAALATPAAAQSGPKQTSVPPYEKQLLRLSEILGAVHYLATICKSEQETAWRDRMNDLITAEKPEPARRRQIVDRFNRGYQGFSAVYRRCTPSAELAFERYMLEGAGIARDIVTRYSR